MEVNAPLELGPCNCIVTNDCPLKGHCLTTNILYEGTITTDIMSYGIKTYKGITEPKFKLRYGKLKKAFNHNQYRTNMELSKEVWNVKDKNANFNVKWNVVKQYHVYNSVSKRCLLCLYEKLAILENEGINLLNKRSEIISSVGIKINTCWQR